MMMIKITRSLALIQQTLILLTMSACFGPTGNNNSVRNQENASQCLAKKDAHDCTKKSPCFWNYDRCEMKPDKEHLIPKALQSLKVKQISVGDGLCAVDEKDQLWCIPKKRALGFPTVSPHPDHRFKNVAATIPNITEKGDRFHVCATKINGESICFKEGVLEPVDGPTKEKTVKTIPFPYLGTVCAITESNKIICQSREPLFNNDKFDLLRATSLPANATIKELYLYRKWLFASNLEDYRLAVLTTKDVLYTAYLDKGVWDRDNSHPNISRVDSFERALCWTEQGGMGIKCPEIWNKDINIPKFLKDPPSIKDLEIKEFAISQDYACGISAANDLICFGDQKIINNFSDNLKNIKAKSLSLSEELLCYIDMDDHVNCAETKE